MEEFSEKRTYLAILQSFNVALCSNVYPLNNFLNMALCLSVGGGGGVVPEQPVHGGAEAPAGGGA